MRGAVVVRHVPAVEARLVPYDWRWARDERVRIDEHWASRVAAQPRLFNGTVLLAADRRFDGDVFRIAFFPVDFAAFLAFRDFGSPDPAVVNAFALGALRASDGAYVLGVMSDHTANAGLAYFPAGTPDPSDVTPDGTVDLAASLLRELAEETGLDPDPAFVEDGWTIVDTGTLVALYRAIRLPDDARTVERRIREHIAADPEAELAGVRLVRHLGDLDERVMPRYLLAYLRHVLT